MQLNVFKALKDGYSVVSKNPIIFVPAFFSALMSAYIFYISRAASNLESFESVVAWYLNLAPLLIATFLISLFLGGMIIKLAYDGSRNKKIPLGECANFVLGKYLIFLVVSVVYSTVCMLGFVIFIIPGIFIMTALVFCKYAVLIGNKTVVNSLKESWKITKKNWWRTFALILIPTLLSNALTQIAVMLPEALSSVFYFLAMFLVTPWSISSLMSGYKQLAGR